MKNDLTDIKQKLMRFCAYQERCEYDVRKKLNDLGAAEEVSLKIIEYLKNEGFLNEERFAKLFVHGKFGINKWGKNKIYKALLEKRVPNYIINKAINEIDDEEYRKTLAILLTKKQKSLKEPDSLKRKQKLVNFALRRGFENALIWEVIGDEV